MRKRLIIELDGDDFRAMLGAILKTGADFKVESVESEPELPAGRKMQKLDEDGKSVSDIVIETLIQRHRIHKHEMRNILVGKGFGHSTMYGVTRRLCDDGLIRKDGDYYVEIKGNK